MLKHAIRWCLALGLISQSAFAQVVRPTPHVSDPLPSSLSRQTRQAWVEHVKTTENLPLQAGCRPYYLAPKSKTIKGTLILLHGFTACAQQSDELAFEMAQGGYHVFVPRLPGHGLAANKNNEKWHDNLSGMPTFKEHTRYADFAKKMGAMIHSQPGHKAIAGVSLGGAIAASAVLQYPNLFNRAVVMTPLFDISAPRNMVLPMLDNLAPNHRIHWGEICDKERSMGRGGYCEFGLTHLRGMQEFGLRTLAELHQLGTRTQLVGVEFDGAASNQAILKASRKIPFGQTCLYEKGASHSMISPYDNQHEHKFWMPVLRKQFQRFINTGQYFDTVGPSQEVGFTRCLSR